VAGGALARHIQRLAAGLAITAGVVMVWPALAAAPGPAVEYAVKAAYLAKFALFLDWPESSFASPASPVTLCIAGNDPFGDTLNRVAEGERVGERPIEIKRIPTVMRDAGCHIVFLGGSEMQSVAQGLAALSGEPVVTVTDSALSPNAT
jgi:hypothetical protein